MENFLQQNTFGLAVLITVLAFAAQAAWLWRHGRSDMPWLVWLLAAALLGLTWSLAERAGEREKDTVHHQVEIFARLYASEMERHGHSRVPIGASPQDSLYRQLAADEKRWLSLNPSVYGIYTLRKLPNGRIVPVVDSDTWSRKKEWEDGHGRPMVSDPEELDKNNSSLGLIFSGTVEFALQPITDRWSPWVSAFVPLRAPDGRIDGALGVDFEAAALLRTIAVARARVVEEMALVLVVLLGCSTLTEALRTDARTRKQTLEALHMSEQHFRKVVHSLPTALSVYDAEANLTLYNKAAETLWGSGPTLGVPHGPGRSKVTRPDGSKLPDENRPVSRALREDASTAGLEIMIERADGTHSYALCYAEPFHGAEGQVAGAVLMAVDLTARREAELRLAEANRKLVDISRHAGMAEVATSVLHNVGNVLNSANISLEVAAAKAEGLRSAALERLASLLRENEAGLAAFFATPQGRQLPAFLSQLAGHLAEGKAALAAELASLRKHLEHLNRIVAMQQRYASPKSALEEVPLAPLIEDALHLISISPDLHRAEVVRDFDSTVPPFPVDRHKLLQILVNLIQNAQQAMEEGAGSTQRLTLQTRRERPERVRITVSDTGAGIASENLARVFEHGFTTRRNGHGFGLHASALAAREMGGSLTAASPGPARGATFTLDLPMHPGQS